MLLPTTGGLGAIETLMAKSDAHGPLPLEQTLGERFNDQHSTLPTSKNASSVTCKRQVPLAAEPDLPLKLERNCCGRKVPRNGAVAERIETEAVSSKVV